MCHSQTDFGLHLDTRKSKRRNDAARQVFFGLEDWQTHNHTGVLRCDFDFACSTFLDQTNGAGSTLLLDTAAAEATAGRRCDPKDCTRLQASSSRASHPKIEQVSRNRPRSSAESNYRPARNLFLLPSTFVNSHTRSQAIKAASSISYASIEFPPPFLPAASGF